MIGVEYLSKKNKWRAFLMVDNRRKIIGTFSSECEAADAYDMYVLRLWKNAKLNNEVNRTIFG